MEFLKNYNQIRKINAKSIFRDLALEALIMNDNLINNSKYLSRKRVHFLILHHIFDDEIVAFDNLLKYLSKTHEFISYSKAVEKILNGNIDKPYLVFSFDDGFKNNIKAAEILNRYNAKACFFINPFSIDIDKEEEIISFCKEKLHLPKTKFMNWNDVEILLKSGHEIGSHTMSHDRLSILSDNQIKDDLIESYELLSRKCGLIKHFAFPYGTFNDFRSNTINFVFEAGYLSCATAERGCHINDDNKNIENEKLLIRRDQVIAYDKLSHNIHFISKSSKNAKFKENFSPIIIKK